MTTTLYASFADPADAERAAGALLDHGLKNNEISLLVPKEHDAADVPHPPAKPPEASEYTGTSVGFAGADTTGRSIFHPEDNWSTPANHMAYGAEMAGGIESTDAMTHYPGGNRAFQPEQEQSKAMHENYEREPVDAKKGLSTTTGSDVGVGAAKGIVAGVGIGTLAALASMFIPGVGLVIGGGALAVAIAGAVGAAGAGAIAGGFIGLLKDQGVPEEALTVYRQTFDRGGAILVVAVPAEMSRAEVDAVLAKYGAQNVEFYGPVRAA